VCLMPVLLPRSAGQSVVWSVCRAGGRAVGRLGGWAPLGTAGTGLVVEFRSVNSIVVQASSGRFLGACGNVTSCGRAQERRLGAG
jgi:hypothetical protein